MAFDHWLAFVAASAILLAIPGPTVLLVISYALGHGRRATAAVVIGVALGDIIAMTASMLDPGAILATSAAIFTVLRWIGGAYLIYLGISLWQAPVLAADVEDLPRAKPAHMLAYACAVPRSIRRVSFSLSHASRSSSTRHGGCFLRWSYWKRPSSAWPL